MDGVSSAFAVVSLAIQLVETGEKISKFLTSIQDAPSEIIKLGHTLDQLNGVLKQVSYLLEQQYLVLRLPGSPVFITNALENCEKRIKALEDVIQKAKKSMDHRGRVQRSWATMRFVSKKEDIQEMQSQLRDAQAGLQTAMLSNSWQLQMHHISISSSSSVHATGIEESALVAPIEAVSREEIAQNLPSVPGDAFRNPTKETNLVWYRGVFGSVNIQLKSKYLPRSNARRSGTQALTNEKTISITPIYLRNRNSWERRDSVDTLRLLTQSQNEISSWDVFSFWMTFQGQVEGAEFMFSQGLLRSEFDVSDDDDDFLPLARALRAYSTEPSRWDSFIRLLLRKRPGLHMPVSRNPGLNTDEIYRDLGYPCKIFENESPLDELFAKTETPFEGEAAAKGWLQILSSEGYDVGSYLEEEQALHAAQMQISCPDLGWYIPRQLVYHWGSSPSVSWDWWIDPESSTYLVREEFKHMDHLRWDSSSSWYSWESLWPMGYPAWEIDLQRHRYEGIDYKRAQERANRRMRKKSMKAARAQGLKSRDQMPGAWPI
ncbi:MAG: hypothetical protein ASARMPRED_000606 [Alectoria sarmentosa]|nr:MAG: hypothetical protein ASARMPRED_000606 [Alectoria sarmentosa]